jgi:osmotically-inducible protein OsmY
MRTANERLQNAVLDELRWDPHVDVSAIGVVVADGVVTLFGDVPSWDMKVTAAEAVGRVAGVRAIADRLVVKYAASLRRTDTDLACDVADVLRRAECATGVRAHVEDGELRLEGFVDWAFQRGGAESAITSALPRLRGLKHVANDIVVSEPATLPRVLDESRSFRRAARSAR